MIVAIHQPNFFPWLGFFNKLSMADTFIILDNVQFPKKGGTWCNRVKLMCDGKSSWWTLPIHRSFHGTRVIREIEIKNGLSWREKSFRMLKAQYGRSPFFSSLFPAIEELLQTSAPNLVEFNMAAIRYLVKYIGLDHAKIVLASDLRGHGHATELLISLVNEVGGKAYLSGDGSSGYLQEEKFAEAGLQLVYQNFKHPVYRQCQGEEFVSGLSVLDALFNIGFDGLKRILQEHEHPLLEVIL